ncbi:MAG: peptidase inhibitor family I36 protein [Alphaproteobacteria bacterium]|nr:peptidase inhibitor family I36 protein [Alphaproteobacteria bacterium]MBV9863436.1 peptidase inhibitor family I36 protein [Alphaproteobacteria bacterium]
MKRFGAVLMAPVIGAALVVAATVTTARAQTGGCDVVVYWDINYGGESWRTQHDAQFVGQHWNDQISSIRVLSGVWDFYWDINYGGEVMRLGPGNYAYVGDHWNDQISSFRCEQPTR